MTMKDASETLTGMFSNSGVTMSNDCIEHLKEVDNICKKLNIFFERENLKCVATINGVGNINVHHSLEAKITFTVEL